MMLLRGLAVCVLFLSYLSTAGFAQSANVSQPVANEKPLPDLNTFLRQVKQKLENYDDRELVNNYTYKVKSVEESLGKNNTVKDTETKEYEVYHFNGRPYRKLISKNGVPLPPKELKKQDDKQSEKERKHAEREPKRSESERQKKAAQRRKEHEEIINDLFNAFHFSLLGREMIDGHSVIVLAFTPRKEAKLKTRAGNMVLKKVAGKVWIQENEHQPMRAHMEAVDNITLGGGLLAKVDKGTEIIQERRKVNNEVWLPARLEMRLKAKVFMVKGFNVRQVEEYSDYRKFSVNTAIKFQGEAMEEKK